MAELAALSVVANIFQVIGFVKDLYDVAKDIQDTGTSDQLAVVNATHLSRLSGRLETNISAVQPVTEEQHALRLQARECLRIAHKLQKDLNLGKSRLGKLGNAVKARRKRSSIEKHKSELLQVQQAMQTQILGQAWIQDQANLAQQQESFAGLDHQLRLFISQVAAGHTALETLIQREAASAKDHISAEEAQSRHHTTAEVSKIGDRMTQDLDNQQRRERWTKLLASLAYPEMNERRNERRINAYEGTFTWMLEEEDGRPWSSFPSFLTSQQDGLYWISGKAGSGKSTLMKFLASHHRTADYLEEWSRKTLIISYFLWNQGSLLQRNTKGLLSSLAHQIIEAEPSIVDSLTSVSFQQKMHIHDWSHQELERLLFECLKNSARPVCVFLDGLDEIDQHEGPFQEVELIKRIRAQTNTKLCLSSRPERLFVNEYSSCPSLKLQNLTEPDIRKYVVQELNEYGFSSWPDSKQKIGELVTQIVRKADGVFLWVYLVLLSLRKGMTMYNDEWAKLMKRLEQTPTDMYGIYQQMWKRLGDDGALYRQEAASYFNFALDRRDLSLTVIELAFANCPDPQEVICDGRPIPSLESLTAKCERCRQQVENYSAGLLEVTGSRYDHADFTTGTPMISVDSLSYSQWTTFQMLASKEPKHEINSLKHLSRLRQFGSWSQRKVQFIHRSAADFLRDTKEGREILAYDQTTTSERTVQIWQAKTFACLIGSESDDDVGRALLDAPNLQEDNQKQYDPDFRFVEKAFRRQMEELDLLRGHHPIYTRRPLHEVAITLVCIFVQNAARSGYFEAVYHYADFVQSKGFEMTHAFLNLILFRLLKGESSLERILLSQKWTARSHDMVNWLLRNGADLNHCWYSSDWTGYPFGQNLSAFEFFVLSIPRHLHYESDALSLANTLKLSLEHGPGFRLEKKIIIKCRLALGHRGSTTWSSEVDDSGNDSEVFTTYWEFTLRQMVRMAVGRIVGACPQTSSLLQTIDLDTITCHQDRPRLLLVGASLSTVSFYTIENLADDFEDKLNPNEQAIYAASSIQSSRILSEPECPVLIPPNAYTIIGEVRKEGTQLFRKEAERLLQSKGFDIAEPEENDYPEPFHGFSELYGGPDAARLEAIRSRARKHRQRAGLN